MPRFGAFTQCVTNHAGRSLPFVTAALLLAGCQIERFFAEDVAAGAARITVRNAVKLVAFVDEDERCGFRSASVAQGYQQEGETGSMGKVTWTVTNCEIDFGDKLVEVGTPDCNGVVTTARGRVVVSATKTVEGLLTGNPAQPVIPQSPDAAQVSISADASDYEVRLSNRTTGMTVKSGHLDVLAAIHLAQSASLGVCSVPTSDVTLTSIRVKDAQYAIDDGSHVFDVDVPLVEVKGQLGKYNGVENQIEGRAVVWDSEVDLSSDPVLDPDYTTDEFHNSYTCVDDIALPVTYECLPLTPKLAEGAAKLTVNNVGNLLSAVVADTRCGFASPDVVASATIIGEVGRDGGEVLYRIDQPCTLSFPTKTPLDRDCTGKTVFAEGTAHVSGTMRLRGRLSGDPLQPVIPTSRDPVEIVFSASFDHFKVSDDRSDQALEIVQGTLSGRMKPRMALDSVTGACSIATPVVTFEDLSYQPGAEAIVHAQGNALRIAIDGASLDAQNGEKDGRENFLEGNITVDGEAYPIPLSGEPVLDPAYSAEGFGASWACTANMVIPTSDEQCDFQQVIGDGAARLVIQTVGSVASMVNSNSDCGFEDTLGVLISPTEVVGEEGELGAMTWDVEGCTIGGDSLDVLAEDCMGGATFVQGFADVNASRTVTGERTTMYFFVDAIEPRSPQSVTIELQDAQLEDFVTYQLAAGQSTPLGKLTIHEGTLSAVVEPATGARADAPQTYDVPTPIARISQVHLRNARATLEAQGKIFVIDIADTDLSATNGSLGGVTNLIEGSVLIDGKPVQVGGALNPTYSQSSFEQSYLCTENLSGPIR